RPLVDRLVEVPEGDDSVSVRVGEVAADVSGDLLLVEPDVAGEVRMDVIDAGIDDGHDDAGVARDQVPRPGCVDRIQAPELIEVRLIWHGGRHAAILEPLEAELGRSTIPGVTHGPIPFEMVCVTRGSTVRARRPSA